MEAVYKVDDDRSNKRKGRSSSNSQVNICYEAGLEDGDAIISAANAARLRRTKHVPDEPLRVSFRNHEPPDKSPEQRNPNLPGQDKHWEQRRHKLEKTRKTEGAITEVQDGEVNGRRMPADLPKETKSYMLSRPSFTDIRHKGNTYEDIPPSGEVYDEINEPVYEVPMENSQTYDTVFHSGVVGNRQTSESNYNHIHMYKNDEGDISYHYSGDLDDDAFYENNDTMMEY